MRSALLIALPLALLASPPAVAQEAGASVRVETVPGGRTALFASPAEAQAGCVGAGGNFGLRERRFICVNPRRPLQSTRTEPAPPATPARPDASNMSARGVEVDSITIQPGDRVSFTLAEGHSHRRLRRADPSAPGAITVSYEAHGGGARVIATSRTGYSLIFRVLADPDGNGGFSPMGEITLPGDGSPATRRWPASLGAIKIGNFRRGGAE